MMFNLLRHLVIKLSNYVRPGGIIICGHTQDRQQTRQVIEALGRHFEFIHHDDLLPRLAKKKVKPFCLLTFDDGKKINATETALEMERLGVPGMFYVVSEHLSGRQTLLMEDYKALKSKIKLLPPHLGLDRPKELPHAVLKERLAKACESFQVKADLSDPCVGPMSWDDARILHEKGFTVGAHSLRHSIMTNEPEDLALEDIRQSIAAVTREIGFPCKSYAFPNGNYTKYLACHAIECGVETVMTTEPMWANTSFPPWRLPRIQIYSSYNSTRVVTKILAALPGVLLKNPDGTGRHYIVRHLKYKVPTRNVDWPFGRDGSC